MRLLFKTILYCLYVLITLDARNRYLAGKEKGMHCHKITSGFCSFTNHFNPDKEPIREYFTWKEFRQHHQF